MERQKTLEEIVRIRQTLSQLIQTLTVVTREVQRLNTSVEVIHTICELDDVSAVACVDLYEPCPDDPRTCVHRGISPELRQEICEYTKDYPIEHNQVMYNPNAVLVNERIGRFNVSQTIRNFPVAHARGRTDPIPGSRLDWKG